MSDSEQSSNRLELDLISLLVQIEINSDTCTSSVGPSNKDHPFCQIYESALIMQVVLKIYVYYNNKLFGIFQWFHKNQISCLHGLIKHGTLYTAHSITCIIVDTFTTVCLNKMLLL